MDITNLQVRNLKYLAPFSTIANFFTVISYGIIFYFIFRDPIDVDGKHAVGSVSKFPFYIGAVLFSLESVGVVRIYSIHDKLYFQRFLEKNIPMISWCFCRSCHWKMKWEPQKRMLVELVFWIKDLLLSSLCILSWVFSDIWRMVTLSKVPLLWTCR